jgi:hypothetical protein
MSRAFRHLFEKLKETNANEGVPGLQEPSGSSSGSGNRDRSRRQKIRCRAELAEAFNLRAAAGACHLSFAQGEFSETCGKTTKETKKIMPDPFIRTAIAADAERCLAALTLAFSGDPPVDGHGLILNSTWRRSRVLLEHSVAGPLIMEQPSSTRGFPASPSGCRPVQHRTRNL